MCRFLCRHLFSSFFNKCQGAQILGHMVRVCLQKPSICLPKCLYDFAPPPAMYASSCCSIPSPAFGVVSVLDIDHFSRCVVVSLFFFLFQYSCFFKYNFSYLFLAVLGVRCCMDFALVVVSGAALWLWCVGFLSGSLLLLGSTGCQGFSHCGSWAPEHGLNSCDTSQLS